MSADQSGVDSYYVDFKDTRLIAKVWAMANIFPFYISDVSVRVSVISTDTVKFQILF